MKYSLILITCVFAFVTPSLAASKSPENFCNEIEGCTEQMTSILSEYRQGQTDFILKPVSAYSGSCFHLNSMYDSSKEHHGAFAFERTKADVFSIGIFSFFAPADPFRDLTTEELVDWLKKNSSGYQAVETSTNQVQLSYCDPAVNLNYWFRSSADTQTLFVIGEEDAAYRRNLIFCRMNLH